MGTYEIGTVHPETGGEIVKDEVPPSSIMAMQDGDAREEYRQRALGDIDFDLPDLASGQPSFNAHLSSAHLLSLIAYCTRRLKDLDQGAAAKKRSDLVTVLQHSLFLLIQNVDAFDQRIQERKDLFEFIDRLIGVLHDIRSLSGLEGGASTLRERGPRSADQRDFSYRPSTNFVLSTREEATKKAGKIVENVIAGFDPPSCADLNHTIDECGELGVTESVHKVMQALSRRKKQVQTEGGRSHAISFTTYVAALEAYQKNQQWPRAVQLLEDEDLPKSLRDLRASIAF